MAPWFQGIIDLIHPARMLNRVRIPTHWNSEREEAWILRLKRELSYMIREVSFYSSMLASKKLLLFNGTLHFNSTPTKKKKKKKKKETDFPGNYTKLYLVVNLQFWNSVFAITPRSTSTRSSSSCCGPIYGSKKSVLKRYVFDQTVWKKS